MVNKQDSYWMEFILDEKADQKVNEYLRGHHTEYRSTKQKMKELIEQYPNVQAVFETDDAIMLTAEEHEILHKYFQLESGAELIERVPFLHRAVHDVFLRKYACKIEERNHESRRRSNRPSSGFFHGNKNG